MQKLLVPLPNKFCSLRHRIVIKPPQSYFFIFRDQQPGSHYPIGKRGTVPLGTIYCYCTKIFQFQSTNCYSKKRSKLTVNATLSQQPSVHTDQPLVEDRFLPLILLFTIPINQFSTRYIRTLSLPFKALLLFLSFQSFLLQHLLSALEHCRLAKL